MSRWRRDETLKLSRKFQETVTTKQIQERAARYNLSYQEAEDQLWQMMVDDEEEL